MTEESDVDVLLVDDSSENLVALEAILSGLCRRVVKAQSGREALRALLQQDFAVILLDVNMPLMDGFETASLIRQRPRSSSTPIIFVTAHGDDARLARGYSLGAVDFILTPVVPQILRAKVGVFVDLYRKTAEVRRQSEGLARRAEQLHRLADAALAVNEADSIDRVLRASCERALDVIEASSAAAAVDLGKRREHAVRTGDPIPAGVAGDGCVTIGAPLVTRDGNAVGRIDLAREAERPFSSEDRAVLTQLAQMASVAVQNLVYGEEREANRLKDEFLATLSHELRTPLSVIVTWIDLLHRSEGDAATYKRGLDVIERNAKAQAQLVGELLDMSRIMTGKFTIEPAPVELGAILAGVGDAWRPEAQARSIDLVVEKLEAPIVVHADAARLHQLLSNLLGNAVKFTGEGGHVRLTASSNDVSALLVVEDDGIGIAPDFLPHVFDRFRQADSTTTRSYRGLGLGLAVVRHIAELHGGFVRAESEGKGRGARFVVEVPLSTEAVASVAGGASGKAADCGANAPAIDDSIGQREADRESAAFPELDPSLALPLTPRRDAEEGIASFDLSGLGVLLVEDDDGASEAVSMLLTQAGARVRTAASVAGAMSVLSDWRPAVVVSDIGLPVEDGYSLIRKLRALHSAGDGHIPAIAMTAYAHAEERARVLAEGFDAHLAKPVDGRLLLRTLSRYCPREDPKVA